MCAREQPESHILAEFKSYVLVLILQFALNLNRFADLMRFTVVSFLASLYLIAIRNKDILI